MYNIRLQAPKLASKCEIKHWYACGADGRKVGLVGVQGWWGDEKTDCVP